MIEGLDANLKELEQKHKNPAAQANRSVSHSTNRNTTSTHQASSLQPQARHKLTPKKINIYCLY